MASIFATDIPPTLIFHDAAQDIEVSSDDLDVLVRLGDTYA